MITSPSLGFMLPKVSRWLAFGLGSGLSPIIPGTIGTLAAWAIYRVLFSGLSDWVLALILVLGFLIGCWACEATGKALGVSDHGAMVWDEFIAFWLVLFLIPSSFLWQLIGFFVFRFFDMVKPPPIRWFERRFKGGLGVMVDDLVAAAMTLLLLAFFV